MADDEKQGGAMPERAGDERRDVKGRAGQRLVAGSMWGAGVLLVTALVLLLNYFGLKYYHRFDWTGSKLYSLSEKTIGVLGGLDRPVEVTVFLQPGSNVFDPTRELLGRYAASSSRVVVRFVDPEKNLIEAQRLVEEYRLSALDVVVFEAGEDRRVIDASKLADWDYSGLQFGAQPTMTAFKGEEAFTGAILELVERRKPRVLFSSGHGERAMEDVGGEGLSQVRDLLGQENLDLESWSSLGQSDVPAGTDLVVIAGPRIALLPPELDALDRYLDRGGRMLVLLDPWLAGEGGLTPTGLEAWLAKRGVEAGQDLVVDPSATLPFFGDETIFVRSAGAHPIVESLGQAQYPVIVSLARSLRRGTPPAGLTVEPLLETTADGWGETDLAHLGAVAKGEGDAPGPVPVAFAVGARDPRAEGLEAEELPGPEGEPEEPEATPAAAAAAPAWRLVVVGDSDFATNGKLATAGNGTLVANAFNWLLERQQLLGIGPKRPEQVRLTLTPGQLSAITWLTLAGFPALAIGAGVGVWFRRRR